LCESVFHFNLENRENRYVILINVNNFEEVAEISFKALKRCQ